MGVMPVLLDITIAFEPNVNNLKFQWIYIYPFL